MEIREDIRDVFFQLKNLLRANQESGMDPPFISGAVREYLDVQAAEAFEKTAVNQLPDLQILRQEVTVCKKCKLHRTRTNPVFGEGSHKADLMFIGEGPGRDEDLQGRPFVGKAGQLLTKIISAMGLNRKEVYICNIVKCRPPKNRDPEKDEINACIAYLKGQIEFISPKALCVLGRVSGQTLFGNDFGITKDRGKWLAYMDIPVMPTYHPAYLLRDPSKKREAWVDIKEIMKFLGLKPA